MAIEAVGNTFDCMRVSNEFLNHSISFRDSGSSI
jgi:hypothetical protein